MISGVFGRFLADGWNMPLRHHPLRRQGTNDSTTVLCLLHVISAAALSLRQRFLSSAATSIFLNHFIGQHCSHYVI
jgi:hypothetical protein